MNTIEFSRSFISLSFHLTRQHEATKVNPLFFKLIGKLVSKRLIHPSIAQSTAIPNPMRSVARQSFRKIRKSRNFIASSRCCIHVFPGRWLMRFGFKCFSSLSHSSVNDHGIFHPLGDWKSQMSQNSCLSVTSVHFLSPSNVHSSNSLPVLANFHFAPPQSPFSRSFDHYRSCSKSTKSAHFPLVQLSPKTDAYQQFHI